MRPDRRQSGYSLVEVLVAFVILAMALTVLFRIFSGGLRNVDAAANYSRALLVAEERLVAAGTGEALAAGEIEGTTGERYRWTRRITPYEPEGYEPARDSGVDAWRIEVEVTWDAGTRDRRVGLSTIRLERPADTRGARR